MKFYACVLVVCFLAVNFLESEGFDPSHCYSSKDAEIPADVPENLKPIFADFYKLLCCVHFGQIKDAKCQIILDNPKDAKPQEYLECLHSAGPQQCQTISPDSSDSDIKTCDEAFPQFLKDNCCVLDGPIFNPEKCGETIEAPKCMNKDHKEFFIDTQKVWCKIYNSENKPEECKNLSETSPIVEAFTCLGAVVIPCKNLKHDSPKTDFEACAEALKKELE